MTSAELINQTSLDVEYYTPWTIIEAARKTMGGIELDPFSSMAANTRVKADRIFTVADDGFAHNWVCKSLWVNHPFGREYNERFVEKLEIEYTRGHVGAACCITYACTSEKWFQPLLRRPQCFLTPRTNYYLPDGTLKRGVTKGSVVTYFGPNVRKFIECFEHLGIVKMASYLRE